MFYVFSIILRRNLSFVSVMSNPRGHNCLRVAPGHGSSLAPGQRSLLHRRTLQIYTVPPVAARLFGVNVLQCVNIEIFVLLSSPVLTAQQGSAYCCLYLCKLSLMKLSHKGHRQMSSFCNDDVCLFAIN